MSSVLLNARPTGTFKPQQHETLLIWRSNEKNPSESTSIRNNLLAGYTAGVFGVLIGQPFDSLKVWAQTQASTPSSLSSSSTAGTSPKIPGMAQLGSSLFQLKLSHMNPLTQVKNMSTLALPSFHATTTPPPQLTSALVQLRALYAGIQGPLLLVGMVQSVNFAVYDGLRRALYSQQQRQQQNATSSNSAPSPPNSYLHNDPISNIVIAATATGGLLSFLTSPFLVIKTRQQLRQQGFGEAVRHMQSQQRGFFRTFYVGFGPHFLAETVGRAVYFGTYETLKRSRTADRGNSSSLPLGERMLCAGTAGVACWSVIFPLDALKSKMYASTLKATNSTTTSWQMAVSLLRQGQSIRSLYRGFGVTVLRAGPVSAAVLPLYDSVLEYLNASSW